MGLFNRNKSVAPDVPPEVQDYYQAENSQRSNRAWLLGLGTLLFTIILVVGLFFGGRFAYQKLKPTKNPTPVAVKPQPPKPQTVTPPATTPKPQGSGTSPSTPSSGTPGSGITPNTSGSPTATPTPSPAAQNPPATDLPSTGPSSTLAIFAAVTILAYVTHRKIGSRQ